MSGAHASLDPGSLRRAFEADGFVSVPGFLDARELAAVRADLARVVREVVPTMPPGEVYYEDPGDPSTLKQLQRLHVHDAALGRLVDTGPFARLAALLLGEAPAAQNVQFFDKAPGANRPTPAHQDGAYFPLEPMNAVTLWLALEDVGPEQGCVHYVCGSHRGGLRTHRRSLVLGFSKELAEPRPDDALREVGFPCAAGHVLAHHALTVHRADGNRSPARHRRALGFIYYGATCTVDEATHARYQAALELELTAAGRLRAGAPAASEALLTPAPPPHTALHDRP